MGTNYWKPAENITANLFPAGADGFLRSAAIVEKWQKIFGLIFSGRTTDHRHAGIPFSCLESRLAVQRRLSSAPSGGEQIENYTSHEPLLYLGAWAHCGRQRCLKIASVSDGINQNITESVCILIWFVTSFFFKVENAFHAAHKHAVVHFDNIRFACKWQFNANVLQLTVKSIIDFQLWRVISSAKLHLSHSAHTELHVFWGCRACCNCGL